MAHVWWNKQLIQVQMKGAFRVLTKKQRFTNNNINHMFTGFELPSWAKQTWWDAVETLEHHAATTVGILRPGQLV